MRHAPKAHDADLKNTRESQREAYFPLVPNLLLGNEGRKGWTLVLGGKPTSDAHFPGTSRIQGFRLLDSLSDGGYPHGELKNSVGERTHSQGKFEGRFSPPFSSMGKGWGGVSRGALAGSSLPANNRDQQKNNVAWRFFGNVKLTGSFPDDGVGRGRKLRPGASTRFCFRVMIPEGCRADGKRGIPRFLAFLATCCGFFGSAEKPGEVGLLPTFFVMGIETST